MSGSTKKRCWLAPRRNISRVAVLSSLAAALAAACASTAGKGPLSGANIAEPPRSEAARAEPSVEEIFAERDRAVAAAAAAAAKAAEPPPPPADPRAPFRECLDRAERTKLQEERDAALEEAARLAEGLGGSERHLAHRVITSERLRSGDGAAAEAAARRWHARCGPEEAEVCRREALAALARVAELVPAQRPRLVKELAERRSAEECAANVRRSVERLPCLPEAEAVALAKGDKLLQARLALAAALAAARSAPAKHGPLLERAERRCTEVQCADVRREALERLLTEALGRGDVDAAVRLALRQVAVYAATLPVPLRPWARTEQLQKLCARYDAARGRGACRSLELAANGAWTFVDFSRVRRPTEGLSPSFVREVGEHYGALLQGCLAEEGRRLPPSSEVEYRLQWVVVNDGRVFRARIEGSPATPAFEACVTRQFETWRYPRYTGEWQHVEQTFRLMPGRQHGSR